MVVLARRSERPFIKRDTYRCTVFVPAGDRGLGDTGQPRTA